VASKDKTRYVPNTKTLKIDSET